MNKRILAFVFAIVGVAALIFASPVLATSMSGANDGISKISSGQTVDGSAFLAGSTVSIDGNVNGDVFCAGSDIIINGVVEGDVICAGNSLTIGGVVKGDVRAAGNVIRIEGEVRGSATIAGASVQIAKSAQIVRDVTIGASTVNISGAVGRDLKVGGASVVLSTTIGRNVDVEAETFSLDGKITGDLTYRTSQDASIPDGSVAGKINRLEPRRDDEQMNLAAFAVMALMSVLGLTVLSLVVALVMPRYVRRATDLQPVGLFKAFLVGLAAFGVLIPLTIILLVSAVGFMVAVALLLAFVLAGLLAVPLVSFWVGKMLFGQTNRSVMFLMLVGALLVSILGVIPWLGALVIIAAVCMGVGMVVLGFGNQYGKDAYTLTPATAVSPKSKVTKTKK